MARLVVQEGELEPQTFDVDQGLTLGREKHNGIPMPTNKRASRDHAKVWREGPNRYAVADLGSTNGTLVNDERVQRATLADGDLVRVGDVLFRFELDEAEKPKPKAAAERPDLASLLRGEASAKPATAPRGQGPDISGSIEVKQRILQYQKKSQSGSPLRLDLSQTAGPMRWLILLGVLAAAIGLFVLISNVVVSMRGGDEPPIEAPGD